MIAKLIAHAPTREAALDALAAALAETHVEGVTTNLPFLRWLVAHPVVRAGEATTAFLTEHPPLSALPLLRAPGSRAHAVATQPSRPTARAAAGHRRRVAPARLGCTARARVTAPMPGTVIRLEVAAGDAVRPRQPLVVLEAMKMEIPVQLAVRGNGQGRARRRRRPRRRRHAARRARELVEQPAQRGSSDSRAEPTHVHEPDDDRRADVRPEPVDREVRRDPLGQREHEHVDREVREPERHDDQRQRQDREDRLEDRVADREDRGGEDAAAPSARSSRRRTSSRRRSARGR